jgi:hypothetical protein
MSKGQNLRLPAATIGRSWYFISSFMGRYVA